MGSNNTIHFEINPKTEPMDKNENPVVVGLDIGTTKVVAIAGQKNKFGKLEILGLGQAESYGVTHGVVLNIDQCIQSINKAIESCLASNNKLELKNVYVGIAGKHIKSYQTRGDRVRSETDNEISKAEIEALIQDQSKTYIPAGDQIIDVIPQDFIVDNIPNVLNPVGMSGVKIGANFHVITGDRHAIRNIKRCVDKSGLKTMDLVLQPLASSAAVINEQDLEAGVCVVDIGGGTTDVAIFGDNLLRHTAVIPYAGSNITEDIREGLGVLKSQAEVMKNEFGMAIAAEANSNAFISIPGIGGMRPKEISVKNLAYIIECRMSEILKHVSGIINQLNLQKKLNGGIILTGGGSQLKNVVQLTEYVTGIGARIGFPIEHLAGGFAKELKHPKYATCIGLILRGYADYEKGKFDYQEEDTMVSDNGDVFIKTENKDSGATPPEQPPVAGELFDQVEQTGIRKEEKEPGRTKARRDTLSKIFGQIKKGFFNLFEEPGDSAM